MRVLIITQIYLPEMGALSNRLYPIVKELAAEGHEVSVATGMPNYPTGKVFPDHRGKLVSTEEKDGYRIFRTLYYTTPRNISKIKQIISYLSFIPAVLLSGIRAGKCDVVLVTSPPVFPVLAAITIAKFRRARLVFDVRDLWSDELVSFGGISERSFSVRIARRLERLGYRLADLVTITTESLAKTAIGRGAKKDKTTLFPNGADVELFKPIPRDESFADRYQIGDRFVVLYSGLFGMKHGLETLLEAARLLRDREEIVFLLLGNGARREQLLRQTEKQGLKNVIVAAEVSVEEVPKVISCADICFAGFQKALYTRNIISVKVFEYLACEKPVVGAFEGESAKIIKDSEGGIVVAPGNAKAIADAILSFSQDEARRRSMGRSGRRYVEKHFSRSLWARKFERMLTSLISKPRAALTRSDSEKLEIEA